MSTTIQTNMPRSDRDSKNLNTEVNIFEKLPKEVIDRFQKLLNEKDDQEENLSQIETQNLFASIAPPTEDQKDKNLNLPGSSDPNKSTLQTTKLPESSDPKEKINQPIIQDKNMRVENNNSTPIQQQDVLTQRPSHISKRADTSSEEDFPESILIPVQSQPVTLGDRILQTKNVNPLTQANTQLLIEKITDRILEKIPEAKSNPEIIIHFSKESPIPGTKVTITQEDSVFQIKFTSENTNSHLLLTQNQNTLLTALHKGSNDTFILNFEQDSAHDGRSKGQYIPFDSDEENVPA